ncbi:MAG: hypothetical protein MIO92_05620, partial [Methanosarcinaceae archaeon]|nr:hypothetical protein [Methanosarcinaceae archaeon]
MKTSTSLISSMAGKSVIITGPTSGIGKEIALQLGALKANLVLACRDVDKGKILAEEIAGKTGTSNLLIPKFAVQSAVTDQRNDLCG